jgi:hypothetical protein
MGLLDSVIGALGSQQGGGGGGNQAALLQMVLNMVCLLYTSPSPRDH